MRQGFTTYVLTTALMNPSWQLRHSNVLIEDAKKGLRKIRYAKGAQSIYDDEIPSVLKTTAIDFEEGKFEAPNSDVILNRYLQAHPEFNVKYKILDLNKEAEEELKKIELVDMAKDKLRAMDEASQRAMAGILFGDRLIATWDARRVKLELHNYVSDIDGMAKTGVSKTQHFINKVDDPSTEVQFLVLQALSNKILAVSPDKTSVRWGKDDGVIIPIAVGENPVNKMAEFLMSAEGESTLQELGNRIG